MKKYLTLLFMLTVGFSLTLPGFAKWPHKKSKGTTSTTEQGKAHKKHAKNKGATEGQKKGQE